MAIVSVSGELLMAVVVGVLHLAGVDVSCMDNMCVWCVPLVLGLVVEAVFLIVCGIRGDYDDDLMHGGFC